MATSGQGPDPAGAKPNPYVGPRPFGQAEQDRFFGRDEEIAVLEGLVLARRVTLLYAQSGAGKSSLLQAGLIPSLTRTQQVGYGRRKHSMQKMRVLRVLSVGGAIPKEVAAETVANVYVYSALLTLREDPDSALQASEPAALTALSLAEGLAGELPPRPTGEAALLEDPPPDTLLIFDQFEELFTRHAERWREREDFFRQVGEALGRHPALRVLFSMREDYIAELTPYASLLPDQLRSQFRIERLRPAAALEAIRRPAEQAGRSFEEGSAELLVERLRSGPQAAPPAALAKAAAPPAPGLSEFVEPVYLQVVCQRLWSQLADEATAISSADVEQYADVQLALIDFYERALAATVEQMRSATPPVGELQLRAWFGRQLITPSRTRSLVYRDTRHTGGLPNPAVEFLDYEVHIIRPFRRGQDTWYELIHDRLVDPILFSNQKWRTEFAAEWQLLAERWRREDEPPALLLGEADLARAEQWIADQQYTPDPDEERFLQDSRREVERVRRLRARQVERGANLAETGWGIIFAATDTAAASVEAALAELIELRRGQAGGRLQVFTGPRGYGPGESGQAYLTRLGLAPGASDYSRVPYYLLLAGDPERLPFELQYALQTQYAVGRLAFPSLAEYASYARSVVSAESGSFSLLPRVALFSPLEPEPTPETKAFDDLLRPLLSSLYSAAQERDWEIEEYLQVEGAHQHLRELLGGPRTPTVLFSASYGVWTEGGDPEQEAIQGSIMTLLERERRLDPPRELYVAADDIGDEARLLGSMAFLFGSCTAGTPQRNNFPGPSTPPELAPRPFVARLAQRLLGHGQGGALAVIGHVDQAWTASYDWKGVSLDINHFSGALKRLMEGATVGAAFQPLVQRYQQLSAMLAAELQQVFFYDGQAERSELERLNLYTVDARNYIILGDPAARLPLEGGPLVLDRPAITPLAQSAEPPTASRGLEAAFEPPPPQVNEPETSQVLGAAVDPGEPELLYFNGLNGATGVYWTAPFSAEELAALIVRERSPENLSELRAKYQQSRVSNL